MLEGERKKRMTNESRATLDKHTLTGDTTKESEVSVCVCACRPPTGNKGHKSWPVYLYQLRLHTLTATPYPTHTKTKYVDA